MSAPPPRRVLMTLDAVGGVWRYALDAAAELRAGGVEVVLAGFGPRPVPEQAAEAAELVWIDRPLDWMADDERDLADTAEALARLVRDSGADLVHLNLPSQAAGLAVDVPVVVVAHSCVATWWAAIRGGELPETWRWQRRLTGAGLRRADAIVAPSQSHAAAIEACYGPLSPIHVVPNATRPALCRGKAPIVAAAARWWDEGKGGPLLDEVAARTAWPVVAAGATEGPNGAAFAFAHARALGPLSGDEARTLLAGAAIVVSPSRYEPFGLVALEAAAAGAALVLADIPTYRELWNGAALFADPRDPDAFATAIDALVADPPRRALLGEAAAARAAAFSPARQIERLLAAYAAATAAAPQRVAAE